VIVGTKKRIYDEYLCGDVDDVDDLDKHVGDEEVVAVDGRAKFILPTGVRSVAAELHEKATQVVDHVAHDLGSALRVAFALTLHSRVRYGVQGDAGLTVKSSPYSPGGVEEDGLEDQEDGNPLVVADLATWIVLFGNALHFERKKVGACCPTHLGNIMNIDCAIVENRAK